MCSYIGLKDSNLDLLSFLESNWTINHKAYTSELKPLLLKNRVKQDDVLFICANQYNEKLAFSDYELDGQQLMDLLSKFQVHFSTIVLMFPNSEKFDLNFDQVIKFPDCTMEDLKKFSCFTWPSFQVVRIKVLMFRLFQLSPNFENGKLAFLIFESFFQFNVGQTSFR